MSKDADIKQSLLEMSEHEPQQVVLYTSYYNNMRPNKQQPEELSEWTTRGNQDSPTRTTRLRMTEASTFLPRLDLRNILQPSRLSNPEQFQNQNCKEDEEQRESPTEIPQQQSTPRVRRHKRATSIGQVVEQSNGPAMTQLPPRVSTILLSLSLPKIIRSKQPPNDKYSKYPIMSTSLENSLKRAKNRKANKQKQKSELVQLECNGSNPQLEGCRSRARLLNDQLSHYLSQVVQRCVDNKHSNVSGGIKIPSIKYSYRRRVNRSDAMVDKLQLSLEVRNGAVGKLPN